MQSLDQNNVVDSTANFERISPTAWIVAYGRSLTDIPYSQEILEEMEKIMIAEGSGEISHDLKNPEMAPQFEARYKLLNRLIAEHEPRQILEVATGLAPRGLAMAENSDIEYVEVDLPSMIERKRSILQGITESKNKIIPANLHLAKGNALQLSDLEAATRYFQEDKPIVVVNEGLMRYLSFPEKTQYAQNVRVLLMKFGGVWITSDITLKRFFGKDRKSLIEQREKIKKLTGINIHENYFNDEGQARQFFEDLGFSVERHSFLEVFDELISPLVLKQTKEEVENIIGPAVVFVMKVQ